MKALIRLALLAAAAALSTGLPSTLADGIPMTDDFHFKGGTNYTLTLTKAQIDYLESARIDGKLPFPTRLKLTKKQSKTLRKLTNKRVLELNVFEGKYDCCSCCAQNIASRFVPDKLEVSGDLLADLPNLNRNIYDWDTGEKGATGTAPKPQEPEPKQASPQPEGKQAGTGA